MTTETMSDPITPEKPGVQPPEESTPIDVGSTSPLKAEVDLPEDTSVPPGDTVSGGRSRIQPPATSENVEHYKGRFEEGRQGEIDSGPATAENVEAYEKRFYGSMSTDQLQKLAAENNLAAKRILLERQRAEQTGDAQEDPVARLANAFPDPVKEAFHEKFQNSEVTPEALTKFLAEDAGMTEQQVRSLLGQLAPHLTEDEQNTLISKARFMTDEERSVEPEPEPLTPREEEMHTALEQDGKTVQKILSDTSTSKEEKDAAVEAVTANFRDRFPEATKKVLGKAMKYSIVGGGIFGFLLILLMVVHGKTQN